MSERRASDRVGSATGWLGGLATPTLRRPCRTEGPWAFGDDGGFHQIAAVWGHRLQHGLTADGLIGPETWQAVWQATCYPFEVG